MNVNLINAGLSVVTAGAVATGVAFAADYGDTQPAPRHAKEQAAFAAAKSAQDDPELKVSKQSQVAYMVGEAVVDEKGQDDAGDPDGKGSANFLVVDQDTLCYGFMVRGVGT